jgi:cytoskeletal protein RodZ
MGIMSRPAEQLVSVNQQPLTSLGDELRRRRQEQGVELSEISESTRIGIHFLRAVEQNDFKSLPGGLFTRSFIRTYARYVGMDEDLAIQLYFQQTGQGRQEQHDFNNHALPSVTRSTTWINLIIASTVLIVLVYGGFAGWHYWKRAKPNETSALNSSTLSTPPTTNVESAQESSPGASSQNPESGDLTNDHPSAAATGSSAVTDLSEKPLAAAPNPDQVSAEELSHPSGSNVTLVATPATNTSERQSRSAPLSLRLRMSVQAYEECSIAVSADGVKGDKEALKTGDIRTFVARDRLVISTTNPSQLSIIVNGYSIRLPETQIIDGLVITPQNLSQFIKQ